MKTDTAKAVLPTKPNYKMPCEEEIVQQGHMACPGCGIMPAIRVAMKVLGRRTVIVAPACCYAVVDGAFPHSAAGVPFLHSAFEASAAFASGVRAGFDVMGVQDVNVVAWAGDGGTFDIGFQALSAAAERNEDILYVCYDNEAYMNTGIQRSSATPRGAWTTTTPAGATKVESKKDIGAIMAAHRIPYFATASISHPEDLIRKFEIAKKTKGFRFIHYYCPCPTGWKAESRQMIELARLAVETKVFPLYEVYDGKRFVLNANPQPQPLEKYLKIQGRFAHMTPEDARQMAESLDERWKDLEAKCQ